MHTAIIMIRTVYKPVTVISTTTYPELWNNRLRINYWWQT